MIPSGCRGWTTAVLCSVLLAGCVSNGHRHAVDTLPISPPSPVGGDVLPSPPGGPSATGEVGSGIEAWRPYRDKEGRTGRWEGRSAWGHPPNRNAQSGSRAASTAQSKLLSNRDWATRWVSAVDGAPFEAAVRGAASGGEGRWRASDGNYGLAAFAGRVGDCALIEVMLSASESGLPIRSRGTIVDCASSAAIAE